MNLVRSWPQGQAGATPLGWSRPQPLMPPRIEGWPRGVVPSGNAEALLESAVAYWDASKYRPGDRFLRNQGVAGELLDLRLGSSVVANTNDPLYLAPEQSGYVYLPGVAGNYLSVPDANELDITGDIDIRVKVALSDWTPAAQQFLAAKYNTTGNQRSWQFGVNTNGTLDFIWSTDGTATTQATSSVALTVADGAPLLVRVVLDVNDGGVYKVYFYTSADGAAWTQLGSTVTGGTTTSIYASTAVVEVGSRVSGTLGPAAGSFYRALVLNGIDGTTVLDVDCDAITSGSATSFTATTGQTVTINRSTSGRKSVAMPSRWNGGRPCFLFGTDDYMEVQDAWQHQLLNFGQGDSFTVLAVARGWATRPNNTFYLSKSDNTTNFDRWGIRDNGTAYQAFFFLGSAGVAGVSATGATTLSSGQVAVFAGVVNRSAQTLNVATNGTLNSAAASVLPAVVSNRNPASFRIGATTAIGTNNDIEFTAAAVFRRALTAAEITTLSTYWGS